MSGSVIENSPSHFASLRGPCHPPAPVPDTVGFFNSRSPSPRPSPLRSATGCCAIPRSCSGKIGEGAERLRQADGRSRGRGCEKTYPCEPSPLRSATGCCAIPRSCSGKIGEGAERLRQGDGRARSQGMKKTYPCKRPPSPLPCASRIFDLKHGKGEQTER